MLDVANLDKLQRDSEASEDEVEAALAPVEGRLKNLHTLLPGIVTEFNADTQVASVQPAIQRLFTALGPVNLPVCVDVPVEFPGGGGFQLTFPVAAGDECTLSFSERCIDFWHENGGVQLPAAYRMHDLSDAFARVGVNSKPNKLASFSTDGAELRTRSRNAWVKIKQDGTVEVENGSGKHTLKPTGEFKAENAAGLMDLGSDGSFTASNAAASFIMSAAGAFVFNGLSFTVNAPTTLLNTYATLQGGLGSASGIYGSGVATFNKPVIVNDTFTTNSTTTLQGKPWLPHTHAFSGSSGNTAGVN